MLALILLSAPKAASAGSTDIQTSAIFNPPGLNLSVPYVYAYSETPDHTEDILRTSGIASVVQLSCIGPNPPPGLICGGPGADADAEAYATFNHLGATVSMAGTPPDIGTVGLALARAWSVDFGTYDYTGDGPAYVDMTASIDGFLEGFSSANLYLALEPPETEPYSCMFITSSPGQQSGGCTVRMPLSPGLNPVQIQLRLEVGATGGPGGGGDADFSHTARIDSVFLEDGVTGALTPVTLQGDSGTIYGAAEAAPEPGSLFLLACGGVAIAWLRKQGTPRSLVE
jgi:hypothetical protein